MQIFSGLWSEKFAEPSGSFEYVKISQQIFKIVNDFMQGFGNVTYITKDVLKISSTFETDITGPKKLFRPWLLVQGVR